MNLMMKLRDSCTKNTKWALNTASFLFFLVIFTTTIMEELKALLIFFNAKGETKMSKNMIYGAGVLGIIAAAIYIYQEHKKAKEAESESVVNVDSEEETEEQTKEQKKEVITEKVTSLGRKIGKTVGTAALKFGAKHPKITKFILIGTKYIPYAVVGLVTFATLHKMTNRNNNMIDGSDLIYEGPVYDERFDGPIRMETNSTDPQKTLELWQNTDLSSNFQKLQELLRTLNLAYSERYEIDNKESFADAHPEYDVSEIKDNFVIRQIFNVQDFLDHNQQQQ